MPDPTPSQTAGPYVAIGMAWCAGRSVAAPGAGATFTLSGSVRDGAGEPVGDAALEFWQPDPAGSYLPGASWRGFTRALTDLDGAYAITTVKPGGAEAPHISISIFARGLQQRLVTHAYFADEPAANGADPVLAAVDPSRRSRLLAVPVPGGYRFDIVLQGEEETPFFVP